MVEIDRVVKEANNAADKYGLELVEIDKTDNIISLRLIIDSEVFIKIYGNAKKDKLNLTLVFKRKRIYGCDSESGKNHCHPFNDPDSHVFIKDRKPIREFVEESMKFLEETYLL
jgi:hypothetical protein